MFASVTDAFVSMRAVDAAGGDRFVVVDAESFALHADSTEFLESMRIRGCSSNTTRAYAGRVALFVSWCRAQGMPWREVDYAGLSRFMTWVSRTPYSPTGQLR